MWFPGSPVEIKGETEDLVFRDLKAFEVQSFRVAMSLGEDFRSSRGYDEEKEEDEKDGKKKSKWRLRRPQMSL